MRRDKASMHLLPEIFGIDCDGYAAKPTTRRRYDSIAPYDIVPRLTSLMRYRPIIAVLGSEEERRYYQLLCDQTAFELGGSLISGTILYYGKAFLSHLFDMLLLLLVNLLKNAT
jgi:hypothetical protein